MGKTYKSRKKINPPKLREIREYFSLNQSELAEFIGIEQNDFSRYENGIHEFYDELKIKLIDFIMSKYEKRININWFLTGEGEMFLSNQENTPNPGALIDQRLEKLEARMTEIENRLKETSKDSQDSAMYAHDPETEYGAEGICRVFFAGNIAAGPSIPQSEDRTEHINVPKGLIKDNPKDYYAARIQGDSMIKKIPDGSIVLIKKSDTPKHNRIQVVRQGNSSTLKRLKEHEGNRWTLEYEDGSGKHIEPGPGDEIQGDYVAILPEGK